jgi:Xaa-Pro dipeptidase
MATEIRPDDRALRLGRRERALAQMDAHDLDVLVLGRTANVRYVTGTPTLWTAGTSSFGPACMLVRSTGSIHLLSTWDEGIPEDIPRENLFGLTWNPMNTIEVLRRVEGAAGARRVGTDAMSPAFAQLLPVAFPAAELVDGEVAMRAARRIKTAEELAVLRQAVAVAETSLAKAVAELRPGVSEKELAGVLLEAAAAGGVTTPAVQDAAVITSRDHPWRRAGGDGRVAPGDLVAFTAGVVAHGYIAEVGRTYAVGGPVSAGPVSAGSVPAGPVPAELAQRCDRVWTRLLAACRPGASASALLESYAGAGEALPPMPVARGLGLGFDPPVVTGGLPRTARGERIEAGMVLALTGYVWQAGTGAAFRRDTVLVTSDGPELLTSAPGVPIG